VVRSLPAGLAIALAVVASAQPPVTFIVGEGTGNPGDVAELPVSLESGGTRPAALTLILEYDPEKVSPEETYYQFVQEDLEGEPTVATAPVRPDQTLLDAQKLVSHNIPFPGQLRLVIVGLNTLEIGDGPLVTAAFRLVSGGSGEFVAVVGGDESSATSAGAAEIPVAFVDGGILVGCDPAEAPSAVQATQGLKDRVEVTWDPVATPGAQYRVYRSDDADPAHAVPLGMGWESATRFSDVTARPAQTSGGFACCPPGEVIVFQYYYWVKARTASGCESAFSAAPALGYRGAAKSRPGEEAGVIGDGVFLGGAMALLLCAHVMRASGRVRRPEGRTSHDSGVQCGL